MFRFLIGLKSCQLRVPASGLLRPSLVVMQGPRVHDHKHNSEPCRGPDLLLARVSDSSRGILPENVRSLPEISGLPCLIRCGPGCWR